MTSHVHRSSGNSFAQVIRRNRTAYLFLLPWMVGLIGLTVGPALLSLYYSFTDYSLFSSPRWVGISNYAKLITDSRYLQSVKVTLLYVVVSVPLEMIVALALAVMLNRSFRGITVYRALYYIPSLLGGSVAVALLWQQIFSSDGAINMIFGAIGLPTHAWISSPDTALWTLVALRVWQFGAPMIIFLAGLRQVPTDILEAAEMDGANRWRRFWRIVIPMLSPVIFFNLVLNIINAFQAFTPAFIVSGGKGGPSDSTLFYTLYLYQQAFGSFQMGYASAMAWVLLIIIGIATAVNFVIGRRWVFYGDEGAA